MTAAHRRTAAAKYCGKHTIPALIVKADDQKAWNIAFTENLFRKDLTPVEEAASLKDCIERGYYTVETIAKTLGRSAAWVAGRLELIEWPGVLTEAIHLGLISVSAARWIAKIEDLVQVEILTNYAVENGATERATAAWYQSWMATRSSVVPENVEPLASASKVRLPEPMSPCVICQKVHPMRELSYLPVCSDCGENLIAIARDSRSGQGAAVRVDEDV